MRACRVYRTKEIDAGISMSESMQLRCMKCGYEGPIAEFQVMHPQWKGFKHCCPKCDDPKGSAKANLPRLRVIMENTDNTINCLMCGQYCPYCPKEYPSRCIREKGHEGAHSDIKHEWI